MKLLRSELIEVMDLVRPGLAADEIVEQANAFIFTGTHLVAFNDDVFISCPFETVAAGEPPEKGLVGAVRADEFYTFIQKLKDAEIDISVSSTAAAEDGSVCGKELRILGKKVVAGNKMYDEPAQLYKVVGTPKKWDELPDGFMDAIKVCRLTTSTDTSRPVLTCVHVIGRFVESCDKYRLTRWTLPAGAEKIFAEQTLIPTSSTGLLLQYGATHVGRTPGWIHFRGKDVTFACRVFQGDYPSLDPFLGGKGIAVEFVPEMVEVLGRAAVYTDAHKQKGVTIATVTVTLREGRVTVSSKGDQGWSKERVPMEYKGPTVSFTLNSALFLAILKNQSKGVLCAEKKVLELRGENYSHAIVTTQTADET